tara:strand:- start:428 stop:700 length:273 start_codon:yes stop_codon:yes gene_type:complete
MSPIGLGISISGSVYGGASNAAAVAIEDYMWDGVSNGGVAGELTPTPTTYDFHDTWDLDGTDYTLQAVGDIGEEGYWELDDNNDVQPLNV